MKNRLKPPLVKRVLFSLILMVFFFLFLEVVLRLAGFDKSDSLLNISGGFSRWENHFVIKEEDGFRTVRTKSMPRALFNRQLLNPASFNLKPGPGVFRIVLLGGSTTYGWPLDDRFSYASWLRTALPVAGGGKIFEVLNFGVPGYGSRRILNLFKEIIRFDPDLVIFLTGHNEVLESEFSRSLLNLPEPLVAAHTFGLIHSRLYGFLNYLARLIRRIWEPEAEEARPHPIPHTYHRQRSLLLEEMFRQNLKEISRLCREEGIPLLLCTVPANIRDIPPNGNFPLSSRTAPISAIPKLMTVRPHDALLHYRYGRHLYQEGKYQQAKTHLQKACDYDPIGLRVTSSLNQIIRRLATAQGIYLLPLIKEFEKRAPHGIPGHELFFDNCHPDIESHQMIALAILRFLGKTGLIPEAADREEDFRSRIKETSDTQPLTDRDHYRYWQNMASFYRLHGDHAGYRQSREKMKKFQEKIGH